ncbi:MAG: adenosine deaminase [Bacteroidia bacterium]|jgi:adenosine deaminase|nr:adenosine deaminase [Bacteroidia bacterium]
MTIQQFITAIPKSELHLHIEGSFEPELMFAIAQRNGIQLKYKSAAEVKEAYKFSNLQDFLDIYYAGAGVLLHEQDFYDLTRAYLLKCKEQNVVHTEIFFDPQTHTDRGVAFDTVINGIWRALREAEAEWGITSLLIMSYLRHLSEESAFETLQHGLRHKDKIVAVGLDSSEKGNPPSKFERVFAASREAGFLTVAHAGEEGPSEYIHEALNLLHVSRIDHGNRCLDDESLVQRLVEMKMPLTLCPLSNVALRVIQGMEEHPVKRMLDLGLRATIHSDDPAYFGGYMNENYLETARALHLTKEDVLQLVVNSFEAGFDSAAQKAKNIAAARAFYEAHKD